MDRTQLLTIVFALAAATPAHAGDDQPQKLIERDFTVCGRKLKLEVADEEGSRQVGLMFRTGIPEGKGMLFAFAEPRPLTFWMHNVPFDIDIGFFDSKGRLLNSLTMAGTTPMQRPESLPRYPSKGSALFAVEVPKGFFSKLKAGCKITPLPTAGR
jgi:uncharacterized membrane protein (UPF0127 family)